MRGQSKQQPSMLALVSTETFVPEDHPLRKLKPLVDKVLRDLSPLFDEMYAERGRPSVPPERLLKAWVLMALYRVRGEKLFCDQLNDNLLFRWFLDMDLQDQPFHPTSFTKNRQRLLEHEVAERFFAAVVELAEERELLSHDHFSVDGTTIQAWASNKSFRPKDEQGYDSGAFQDFRGEKRRNDTHVSKTDPEAKLYRKGNGQPANLAYLAHGLMENRNGLLVDFEVTQADGRAEREAAIDMVDKHRRRKAKRRRKQKRKGASKARKRSRRITLAADKAYDTQDFVRRCRERRVTPHVAQLQHARRRSAIDGRTTHHPGYRISQTSRLLVEKVFGWMKAVAGFRRSRFRGRARTRQAGLMVAATYNLSRIANLQPAA